MSIVCLKLHHQIKLTCLTEEIETFREFTGFVYIVLLYISTKYFRLYSEQSILMCSKSVCDEPVGQLQDRCKSVYSMAGNTWLISQWKPLKSAGSFRNLCNSVLISGICDLLSLNISRNNKKIPAISFYSFSFLLHRTIKWEIIYFSWK